MLPKEASRVKRRKAQKLAKEAEDVRIQETNNSSIVSKRSVEKLYYTDEPHWFQYFVPNFKRRAPTINRGYWLRMRAVEHTIERFLQEASPQPKIVVNLGCGYDPVPWLFLGGSRRSMCENAKFIDVDYPLLMNKKVAMLERTSALTDILTNHRRIDGAKTGLMFTSQEYAAVGCDLGQVNELTNIFGQLGIDQDAAILFIAEVSIAYMDLQGSQAVIQWASSYKDARFCLLEQHLPDGKDHPFAQTMLKHFKKIGTPLRAIGTMGDMCQRFIAAGWPADGLHMRSLWRLWSDPTFLTDEQRRRLDAVEPFDEWEELALFASHYFLLVARMVPIGMRSIDSDTKPRSGPALICEKQTPPSMQHRFSTLLPPERHEGPIGITGGLGSVGRLIGTSVWALDPADKDLSAPPAQEGMTCQSAANLGSTTDCLLVGGRASPNRSSKACWLRRDGTWTEVQSLPNGLYRHCLVSHTHNGIPGVILFGGKHLTGSISSTAMCYEQERGWYPLEVKGDTPAPRFGATMDTELLLGGMTESGIICEDVFKWHRTDSEIVFSDVTDRYTQLGSSLHRFGAHLTTWHVNGEEHRMLIGGVGSRELLTKDTEVLDLTTMTSHAMTEGRPLLTCFNIKDRTCIGGGATCFSFGTYWNASYTLRFEDEVQHVPAWQQVRIDTCATTDKHPAAAETLHPTAHKVKIPSVLLSDQAEGFFEQIVAAGQPVKLWSKAIGPCLKRWTPAYLAEKLGQRQVVVHASDNLRLDFLTKNFQYITQPFKEFLTAAQAGKPSYLRALSASAPSKEPANLQTDFPEIADDFQLPDALKFVEDHMHSSVLRIASAKTIMWLHYDVMANVLCQISGKKTLYLYPPSDIEHLGIGPGMSSSSIDVFAPDGDRHPSLEGCHPHEVQLYPGDILYIPPLWSHSAEPKAGLSVAVNVFFRDLSHGYAAGRDVYGNRDLAAYEKGRKDVAMIAKAFDRVPPSTRHFYLKRLAMELKALAETGSGS